MIAATFFVALIFIVFFTCPVISGTTYADESHCYKHNAYFLYLVHNSVISSWTLIIFSGLCLNCASYTLPFSKNTISCETNIHYSGRKNQFRSILLQDRVLVN